MNIQRMLQQAQKAQEGLQRALGELEVEGTAGGGLVKVRLNGLKELRGVSIDPQAVEERDVTLLADLVTAAWDEASRQLEERTKALLGQMGLPPGLSGML
jgi:DNA-binding YbaB/EbfC family protein